MSGKKLTTDEALYKVFEASLEYSVATDKLHTDFLKKQIEFHEQLVKFKAEEEPLKIFKKAHKKWEQELDELERQLCDSYEKLGKEFTEQQEFYRKLKEQ